MAKDSFVDFIVDQLRRLGPVTTKPLAGGYRLFRDRIPFGYVHDGRVYFSTTELTRRSYLEHDMGAYRETDSPLLVNYYEVPSDVLDDPETLVGWARVALAPSAPDDDSREEETIDMINEYDEVVGRTTIAEAYRANIPHRVVYIFMFNEGGDMLLQRRSKTKSYYPDAWSTAAGGHVAAGETYDQAALREVVEELGVATELTRVATHWYVAEDGVEMSLGIFRGQHNGPFHINPVEVSEVKFFSADQIAELIATREPMQPELLFLLQQGI